MRRPGLRRYQEEATQALLPETPAKAGRGGGGGRGRPTITLPIRRRYLARSCHSVGGGEQRHGPSSAGRGDPVGHVDVPDATACQGYADISGCIAAGSW